MCKNLRDEEVFFQLIKAYQSATVGCCGTHEMMIIMYTKLDFSNTVPRRLGRIPASICQASELSAKILFKSVASHRKFKESMVLENVVT